MLAANQEAVPKVIALNSLDIIRFDYQITYDKFSQRTNDYYSNVISPPRKKHPRFYLQLKANYLEAGPIESIRDNLLTNTNYLNYNQRIVERLNSRANQEPKEPHGMKLMVIFENVSRQYIPRDLHLTKEEPIDAINNFKVHCNSSIINKDGQKCFTQDSTKYFPNENNPRKFPTTTTRQIINYDEKNSLELFYMKKFSDLEAKSCLPEGKLTFMCEFTIEVDTSTEEILLAEEWRITKLLSESKEKFQAGLADLRLNGKFTDLTLVFSNGKELHAHKAILAAHSEIFEAMFNHDTKEANENRVEITDITVEVFEELLRYLYTDNVPSIEGCAEELLIASDKYQLNILKEICEEALCKALSAETVSNYVLLADTYNAPNLKSKALAYFQKNTENSISVLFENNKADVLLQAFRDLSIGANSNIK